MGNIKTKNGSGEYLYGTNAGPHAVTSAYGLTYHYNANGGMTEATDSAGAVIKKVEYSAFNKPTLMTKGSAWSRVVYGPNKQRLKREDSTGRTRLYIGGLYEETERGGIIERLHYVGDFAVYVEKVGLEQDSYHQYLHRDHLGSIVAKTTDQEPSLNFLANGAWGERRFMAWDGPADPDYDPANARGFTNHEHLDPVGLIHMNGRVYDPELGRFLSPDPLVQAPYNSQSYNRYSYVFNNPLSYTDPSGYQSRLSGSVGTYDTRTTEDLYVTGPSRAEREAEIARQQAAMQSSYYETVMWHANQGNNIAQETVRLHRELAMNGAATFRENGEVIKVKVNAQNRGALRSLQAFKNLITNMDEATDMRDWLYSIDDPNQLNMLARALGMDEYVGSLDNPIYQKYFRFRVDADIISLTGLKRQSAEIFQFGRGITEEIIDAALMRAARSVPLGRYTPGKNKILDYYGKYDDLKTLYEAYGVMNE